MGMPYKIINPWKDPWKEVKNYGCLESKVKPEKPKERTIREGINLDKFDDYSLYFFSIISIIVTIILLYTQSKYWYVLFIFPLCVPCFMGVFIFSFKVIPKIFKYFYQWEDRSIERNVAKMIPLD